jgi:hypothetical protein
MRMYVVLGILFLLLVAREGGHCPETQAHGVEAQMPE